MNAVRVKVTPSMKRAVCTAMVTMAAIQKDYPEACSYESDIRALQDLFGRIQNAEQRAYSIPSASL